jgi:hypothetical protein
MLETDSAKTVGALAPDGKALPKGVPGLHDGVTPKIVEVIGADGFVI